MWRIAEVETDHTFKASARPAPRTWSSRGEPCKQVAETGTSPVQQVSGLNVLPC